MKSFWSPYFYDDVEKATSASNVTEDWTLIMKICDRVRKSSVYSKNYYKSIIKRMCNQDPRVVLQAITLLNTCINNCGKQFLLEVASNNFNVVFRKLMNANLPPEVTDRLKYHLKKWAENEFKSDPQLSLIPSLYTKLKQEGVDFSSISNKKTLKEVKSNDSSQTKDNIAKAIELLMKNECSGQKQITDKSDRRANLKKVKALYTFEGIEDNDLPFLAGDVIYILDSSDPYWWKGFTDKHPEGMFPVNYVKVDLPTSKETVEQNNMYKRMKKHIEQKYEPPKINEGKIDHLILSLRFSNLEDDNVNIEKVAVLEAEVNAMKPMIEDQLKEIDSKHSQLTILCNELLEADKLYKKFTEVQVYPYASKPQTKPIEPPTISQHNMIDPLHTQSGFL